MDISLLRFLIVKVGNKNTLPTLPKMLINFCTPTYFLIRCTNLKAKNDAQPILKSHYPQKQSATFAMIYF